MIHRISSVKAVDSHIIESVFFNGTVKRYDVSELYQRFPQLVELEEWELFKTVKVDSGGCGIFWNDELDLDAETIWEDGNEVRIEPQPFNIELANALTSSRNKANMTQRQLAEKTGVYQADISKIERGISNPSIATLVRLADGLGMRLKVSFE